MIEDIIQPTGTIEFGDKVGQPLEEKPELEGIYQKIISDLIMYWSAIPEGRKELYDEQDQLRIGTDGELRWADEERNNTEDITRVPDTEVYFVYDEIPIPTLDVLSCYMEHGKTLREYQRIIGYEDETTESFITIKGNERVFKNPLSIINSFSFRFKLPEELFNEENITKAKEAGLDINPMLDELKNVKEYCNNNHYSEIKEHMADRLQLYCPQELRL